MRTEKLGFVFQSFNLLARTTAPAERHHAAGLCPATAVLPADARRLAETLLDRVGLADRVHHEPSQMSGGQQQRVAIGRALVNRPALLLADEPTGNLDSHTSVEILRMFQQLNAEGITVVLVTHDPKVAAYAHRTIRIVDGMVEGDEVNPSAPEVESSRLDLASARTVAAVRRHLPACDPADSRDAAELPAGRKPAPTRSSTAELTATPATVGRMPPLLPATWRTALGALRRNKMRSGLSALGVIIAVAAVIAMTEIGQGSKATPAEGHRQHGGQHADDLLPARPPPAA